MTINHLSNDRVHSMVVPKAETAVAAAAAQAESQVKAMYAMAIQRPRDLMEVRHRLLNECKRPGLAEDAMYTLTWAKDEKTGKAVTGPSIRLAEAAIRSLTNVFIQTTITYDDPDKRMGQVLVLDLESNTPINASFSFEKTREVKKLRDGMVVLGERTNSYGKTVFKVRAEDAQVSQKQESQVSKLIRNMIFRLLPGDIKDEAIEQCLKTMAAKDAEDPKAVAKKLSDAFSALGISIAQMKEYLGHDVDTLNPDEAAALRGIFAAIRDKEATWDDIVQATDEDGEPLSKEDKADRAMCIRALAQTRINDREAHDEAFRKAGIHKDIVAQTLPIETLRKVRDTLREMAAPENGTESTGNSAADAGTTESNRQEVIQP